MIKHNLIRLVLQRLIMKEHLDPGTNNQPTTFKKAIDELITAVNKGLNIAGDAERTTYPRLNFND